MRRGRRRTDDSDESKDDDRPRGKIAQGDTVAWLVAAFGVLAPILAVLIAVIVGAYAVMHFLFLR